MPLYTNDIISEVSCLSPSYSTECKKCYDYKANKYDIEKIDKTYWFNCNSSDK